MKPDRYKNIPPIPQWQPETKYIPQAASLIAKSEDPETKRFHLSFEYYKEDACEIELLEKNGAKRVLRDFKVVGKCSDFNHLKNNGIGLTNVADGGEYKSLYNGLTGDIQLKEHIIQGTARLFYFTSDKIFYIRLIKNDHFETKKHRK